MSRQLLPTKISLVHWNLKDVHNLYNGAYHRMAVDTQALTILRDARNGLLNNVRMQYCFMQAADRFAGYLESRIQRFHSQQVPLCRSGALFVIEQLRKTQPRAKIQKLLQIVDKIPWGIVSGSGMSVVPKSGTQVFIKNEGYPSGNKPPRLIAFPQEGEKLLMSMAFFHIMHPLFSSPYCTKEIDEHARPKFIERRLGDLPHRFVADYTSFECVPNKFLMQLGEHRVLRRLVSPEYSFLFDLIERGGTLRAKSGFSIRTPAVQFSGRYTTSMSNTIRNKLLLDACAIYMGIQDYRAVYEGDDSLSAWPETVTVDRLTRALGRLGVEAEIAQIEKYGEAGYCSTYWNDEFEVICDPIKVIATFPFSNSQLANSQKNARPLLAAKAMSLAYRAPGCPIVWAIARKYISSIGLMETRNEYERRWFRSFSSFHSNKKYSSKKRSTLFVHFDRWDLIREPTSQQRQMFEKIFGVSAPNQRMCEKQILEYDGFSETLFSALEPAQAKLGVNLDELRAIYRASKEKWIH